MNTLTVSDWAKLKEGEAEIGFAWVEPDQGWVLPHISGADAITVQISIAI